MRNFTLRLFLALTLLAPLGLAAQDLQPSQVTIVARNHFQGSVPGVTPSWKQGNKGSFEAWFQQEGVQKVYVYDSQGSLRIKKAGAKSAELPAPLTASLSKQYGKADFKSAYKVTTADKKKYFEVLVARPTGDDYWQFTPEGTLIGKRINSGEGTKPVVATAAGGSNATQPRADASPVPNAPGYEDDSKDLYMSDDMDILDEDPLEDIDILEEEETDEELLDDLLEEEEEMEDFDDEMENDLNGDL